jgi:hypothetical protein
MKGGICCCRWEHPFFGLRPEYRRALHSNIFDLIYHGNGGFNFSDVYNMPVWARKFYMSKIVEFKQIEKKAYEDRTKKVNRNRNR